MLILESSEFQTLHSTIEVSFSSSFMVAIQDANRCTFLPPSTHSAQRKGCSRRHSTLLSAERLSKRLGRSFALAALQFLHFQVKSLHFQAPPDDHLFLSLWVGSEQPWAILMQDRHLGLLLLTQIISLIGSASASPTLTPGLQPQNFQTDTHLQTLRHRGPPLPETWRLGGLHHLS